MSMTLKTASILILEKFKDTIYDNGMEQKEFIAQSYYNKYSPFWVSFLQRGPNKGKMKFLLKSQDYTTEIAQRKEHWKFVNASSKIGHITKLKPVAKNRFTGDIKGTRDKILVLLRGDFDSLIVVILPGKKSDYTIDQEFADGALDEEIDYLTSKVITF